MLAFYRLARGAGHSIFASLAFALFRRSLPGPSVSSEQQMRNYLARVADLDKKERDDRQSRSKSN
jgi:hypothetical protein